MEIDNPTDLKRSNEHAYSKGCVSTLNDSCLNKAVQSGSTHVKLFGTVGQLRNVLEQLSDVTDTHSVNEINNNLYFKPGRATCCPESISVPTSANMKLMADNNALPNDDTPGARPFLNDRIAAFRNNTNEALEEHKGMFSIEQHFVCLICSTCLKTDYALLLHLKVHIAMINKQETNITGPSSSITDDHSDHVFTTAADLIKCDNEPGNTDSDMSDTTETLHNNPNKMDTTLYVQTKADVFPSMDLIDATCISDMMNCQRDTSTTKPQQTSDYVCLICQSHFTDCLDLELHSKQNNCTKEISSNVAQNSMAQSIKVESFQFSSQEIDSDTKDIDKVLKNIPTHKHQMECVTTCNQEIVSIDLCSLQMGNVPPVTDVISHISGDNTENLPLIHIQGYDNGMNIPVSNTDMATVPTYLILDHGSKLLPLMKSTVSNTNCKVREEIVSVIDRNGTGHSTKKGEASIGDLNNKQKCLAIPTEDKTTLECSSKLKDMRELSDKNVSWQQAYYAHVKNRHLVKKSAVKTKYAIEKFECPYCQKTFLRHDLQQHIRTHTGEKPYMCAQCGHQTNSIGDLNKHIATHSDERPYICSICNKGFKRVSTLANHNNIHTGKIRYKCDICPKAYMKKTLLIMHKARMHI